MVSSKYVDFRISFLALISYVNVTLFFSSTDNSTLKCSDSVHKGKCSC